MASNVTLGTFLPDEDWFAFRPHGIHGIPHVTRVLIWTSVIVARIGRIDALRWRELFWAAAVHDVARVDDGVDRGHGTRAARWVEEDLATVRTATGSLDIAFIAELCRWHEVADGDIERLSLELLILKDADGLDRCRIADLDPRRLRFQTSLDLVEPAATLERATADYGTQNATDTLQAARTLFPDWIT